MDDSVIEVPTFTQTHYETIALLFIAASFRAVPAYHLAIDRLYNY